MSDGMVGFHYVASGVQAQFLGIVKNEKNDDVALAGSRKLRRLLGRDCGITQGEGAPLTFSSGEWISGDLYYATHERRFAVIINPQPLGDPHLDTSLDWLQGEEPWYAVGVRPAPAEELPVDGTVSPVPSAGIDISEASSARSPSREPSSSTVPEADHSTLIMDSLKCEVTGFLSIAELSERLKVTAGRLVAIAEEELTNVEVVLFEGAPYGLRLTGGGDAYVRFALEQASYGKHPDEDNEEFIRYLTKEPREV